MKYNLYIDIKSVDMEHIWSLPLRGCSLFIFFPPGYTIVSPGVSYSIVPPALNSVKLPRIFPHATSLTAQFLIPNS